MIFILSNSDDFSTNSVLDWLSFYKKKFIRVNSEDLIEVSYDPNCIENKSISYYLNINFNLLNSRISINTDEITSFWYRRGFLNFDEKDFVLNNFNEDFFQEINYHLKNEFRTIASNIYHILESKKSINKFHNRQLNKLSTLSLANMIGLNTPKTYILNKKSDLQNLIYKFRGKKFITKSFSENLSIVDENYFWGVGTIIITKKLIDKLPDTFFYTLIQEYIKKEFEIRTFYINGETYSMAIMSQSNPKTKIDYRNYDYSSPNRNMPFKLPNFIDEKIRKLFKILDLNCGSIDFIYNSKQDSYYFLEINPVGQFGMVSSPCNYKLDKLIANFL